MKKAMSIYFLVAMLGMPGLAMAAWSQVAATSDDVLFIKPKGMAHDDAAPVYARKRHHLEVPKATTLYHLNIVPGSLKGNLERIMRNKSWDLRWLVPYDYHVDGHANFIGKDLNEALEKLIQYYPVRIVFYEGNKIMTVQMKRE